MTDFNGSDKEVLAQTFSIYDFAAILKKRWPIIVSIFILVSFIGIYKTMQKVYLYRASAKMAFSVPEPQLNPNVGLGSSWANFQINRPSYFSTQMQIIQSEPVARRVAESLNLITDQKNQREIDRAIGTVRGSLSVKSPKDSDMVIISSTSTDPDMTAKIANATAEAYMRYNDEKRYLAYRKSLDGIKDQLADLEKKLEDAQKDLISFIEKEKITSYGDNIQTSDATQKRYEDKDVRSFLESLNSQKVEAEIEVAKLLEKYFEDHPKVKKLKNDLKIFNQKIKEEEQRLQVLKTDNDKEIISAKQKEIRYSILKRKVEVNKQLYDTLIRKFKETDVGKEMDVSMIDIVEYAKRPNSPFTPNKPKEILLTIVMALILSLVVGIALQYVDGSFKKAEDLENFVKYPMLSTIPFLKRKEMSEPLLVNSADDNSNLKEAFRLLRTNLRFSFTDMPGKHIIITSSQKGEGKSTVAANLAFVMAEAGSKILLIDTDMRVRALKQFFKTENSSGLSEYLQGKASFEEIKVKTEFENLFFVPSGPLVENSSILFESDRMKEFITEAGKRYDYVLFDAPPVGYVIDASVLSMLVDGVILVIEAEKVSRKSVQKAIDQLNKGKARIFGTVFNKESLNKKSYYYKYYNYYSADKEKPL